MIGKAPSVQVLHVTTITLTLRFLQGHLQYQRKKGFQTHVACSPAPDLFSIAANSGALAWPIPMVRGISLLGDIKSLWSMLRLLRRMRPDIVHAHTPKAGLIAMVAAALAGVRLRIYHMHGLRFATATGMQRRILRLMELLTCKLAHHVFCVSDSLRDTALAEGLCRPSKLSVPGRGSIAGVDAGGRFRAEAGEERRAATRRELGIPLDSRVIGFVGRVVPEKGLAELETAWSKLRDRVPGCRLLLVGPNEHEYPLPPELAERLTADPKVHRVDFVEDPARYYAALDVLALPSYREGLSVVLLEAAAMERPVVATRVPGCVEAVVEGETGKLVPPYDPKALEDALYAYLADADLARRHGAAARKHVQRDFRPEPIWTEVADFYGKWLQRT